MARLSIFLFENKLVRLKTHPFTFLQQMFEEHALLAQLRRLLKHFSFSRGGIILLHVRTYICM